MKGVAAAALFAATYLAALGQQPQFRTSTSLVRLEVAVTDDGGAVHGLRPDEVLVEDSGVRQKIRLEESTDVPLDLMLVAQPLPSIAYTAGNQSARVSAGLSAFVNQVESRDRLGVFMAGAPPVLLRPLEFGRPTFDFTAFDHGELAAPFDAITASLTEFAESDRRRVLVAFTNAADFRSVSSFEVLAEMARRLGPTFVLVGTPVRIQEDVGVFEQTAGGSPVGEPSVVSTVSGYVFPARLQLLARRTGGVAINLGSGDPAKLIEDMFTWLRTQYVISYEPPPGKGWHPVSVRVNRRGVKVTVREGYFVD